MKKVQYKGTNITYLEATFKYCVLTWHMQLKSTTLARKNNTLVEIKQTLIMEFQNPKSKSKFIMKLKEID